MFDGLNPSVKLHLYTSLESTNDTAKKLPDPQHGTVIIADYQTAGRGRHLLAAYKKRLTMLGRRVIVAGQVPYEATALDIDENCGLIVQKDNGEILTLTAGEITCYVDSASLMA